MKKLLVIVMGLSLILALAACAKAKPAEDNTPFSKEIVISASNFKFDQTEYRIKKGESVKLTLDNTTGVHGIMIKDLKVDLNQNKKSVVITPDKAGSYPFACTIMCGAGHAQMKATLIVEE